MRIVSIIQNGYNLLKRHKIADMRKLGRLCHKKTPRMVFTKTNENDFIERYGEAVSSESFRIGFLKRKKDDEGHIERIHRLKGT